MAVTTIDSKRKQVRNLTTKIEAIQARVLADQSADTAFVELLAGLVNQRKRLQDEIDSTRESRIVNDKQRVIRWLDLMATGGRDKMSTDDRMEVRAILRRLISRVTLTIETEGHKKIIEGRFTIHPANASAPLLCRFTYRPFQGKRKREVSELVEYHVSD